MNIAGISNEDGTRRRSTAGWFPKFGEPLPTAREANRAVGIEDGTPWAPVGDEWRYGQPPALRGMEARAVLGVKPNRPKRPKRGSKPVSRPRGSPSSSPMLFDALDAPDATSGSEKCPRDPQTSREPPEAFSDDSSPRLLE